MRRSFQKYIKLVVFNVYDFNIHVYTVYDLFAVLPNRYFSKKILTTPSEELLLCDNFSISSSGFEQNDELAKGSEPLILPHAIVVLQSFSLTIEPAYKTETVLIFFLWRLLGSIVAQKFFVHPVSRLTFNTYTHHLKSFYELSSYYTLPHPIV